jgi:hypothetical protein
MSESDFYIGATSEEPMVVPEAFLVPQQIHPILHRADGAPDWQVYLKSYCFTGDRAFPPGEYRAHQLPDIAFQMGMVFVPPRPKVQIERRENIELVLDDDLTEE